MSSLGTSNTVKEEHSAAGHVEHFFKKVGIVSLICCKLRVILIQYSVINNF
jgi:hypothetical protein